MLNYLKETLKDTNGCPSSKRLIGFCIIVLWLLLNIFIILIDTFSTIELTSPTVTLLENMGWVGFGLLGISVLEFFGKNKNE